MKLTAFFLVSALVIAACGGSATVEAGAPVPTPAPTSTPVVEAPVRSTAQLMAAAFEQLVTVDSTFGVGTPPFTDYLVQKNLDPAAGNPTPSSARPGRPLNESERAAIAEVLAEFGAVQWIDDPADWRSDDLSAVIEGSVILGIGEPVIDGGTALVPVSLWCGGVCGTWFSYGAVMTDGSWIITGIEGSFAIS